MENSSGSDPKSSNASNIVNTDSNSASNIVNTGSNTASNIVNTGSYTASTPNPSATPSPPPSESDTSLPGFHPVIFPPEILEQLRQTAVSLGKVTLIGHVAGETPPLEEIQIWVDTYLVNPALHPEIQIHQISLITQGYFTLTFTTKEGADKAFTLSPIDCNHHLMFLHAWTPTFSPPPGEASLIWVLFPELPRIYYPYLEYIANTIGRVVWQSEKATNIQKGFPPKIRVLVEDVRLLPGSVSIPLASEEGWFDQRVSYEGMSNQICGKCKNLTIATDSLD